MLYDYRHRVGEEFDQPGKESSSQPDEIFNGNTVYLNNLNRNMANGLLGGVKVQGTKDWVEHTDSGGAADDALQSLLNPLLPSGNVATLLSRLAPVVQSVQPAGTAAIGGVDTTLYDVTIAGQALQKLSDGGPLTALIPSGPLHLWVDSDHRVRRLQFSFGYPKTPITTETSDYTNYGLPVNVAIPLASDVETFDLWVKEFCTAMEVHSPGSAGGIVVFGTGVNLSGQCSNNG
jgi:hypothetical protein